MIKESKPAIYVLIVSIVVLLIVWRLNDISDTKRVLQNLNNQPAPVPDPYPAPAQAPEPPMMTYKVGQMAEIEGNEITLKSWKKLTEHEALLEDIVSPSSNVYMLTVAVKNTSAEKRRIHGGEIRVNHNGTELPYSQVQEYSYFELSPLEKGTARIIFMIPKEATGEMYWYPYSYKEGKVRFEK